MSLWILLGAVCICVYISGGVSKGNGLVRCVCVCSSKGYRGERHG